MSSCYVITCVMSCYITCVMLCYITCVMLCYITCVMLYYDTKLYFISMQLKLCVLFALGEK